MSLKIKGVLSLLASIGLCGIYMAVFAATDENPFRGKALYQPWIEICNYERPLTESQENARDFVCKEPMALWLAEWTEDPERELGEVLQDAAEKGRYAVLVIYNLPLRDCGLYAAHADEITSEAYIEWVEEVASGIGTHEVAVILEPDALPQVATEQDCFSASGEGSARERISLIREAVSLLSARPNASIYIDAGTPAWVNAEEMADLLIQAGIEDARGFSLNVSSHFETEEVIAYGHELSARVGGKGFVVDTSRNGNGQPEGEGVSTWCNIPTEALGELPTANTGDPLVHAFLWVKIPGESDGECDKGDPPSGETWPERLELLYRNSKYDS